MKYFSTVPLPIVNIPVTVSNPSVNEIIAAVLTYFSLATDIENIADDMKNSSGLKPKISQVKAFIAIEMNEAKIAVHQFPDGSLSAASVYFNIYPNLVIERKIKRYFRRLNRCISHPSFKSNAKTLRTRRRRVKK